MNNGKIKIFREEIYSARQKYTRLMKSRRLRYEQTYDSSKVINDY